MRLRAILVVGAALLAGFALFTASASADYYGIAYLHSDANFHGAHMDIKFTRLTVPNPCCDFATDETWVINGSGDTYWIEAGMYHGEGGGGCDNELGSTHFFWAEEIPPGGLTNYHCHTDTVDQAVSGTGYTVYIQYAGNGDWNVNAGPMTGRQSTNNITGSSVLEAGVEVTTQDAQTCANQNYLEWWDANDNLQVGWHTSSFGDATLNHSDNPPYAAWVDKPNHVKDYSNWSC